MLSRRQFLLGLGAAALGNAAYGHWLEPRWLKVTRPHIPLGRDAGQPLRILHLSDLHYCTYVPLAFIDEAIQLGLAEQPDLIAITGDFITGSLGDAAAYARVLSQLPAAAPTFACLGNHDGGMWRPTSAPYHPRSVLQLLASANIPCLINEVRSLRVKGRAVQIFGIGDLWAGVCAPAAAFEHAPARGDALRLVLNHNPDAKARLQPYDWDVMLAGHTHGGQVRIPLFGAPFAPVRDKRYIAGVYEWDRRWLHVSCGVGNLHDFRYNCRPEVSLVTIA